MMSEERLKELEEIDSWWNNIKVQPVGVVADRRELLIEVRRARAQSARAIDQGVALAQALQRYGQHSEDCININLEAAQAMADLSQEDRRSHDMAYRCSCGLSAAIAAWKGFKTDRNKIPMILSRCMRLAALLPHWRSKMLRKIIRWIDG